VREHHRRAVQRLTEALADDPRFDAVLLGGSLARGTERSDSDVDLILIATPEEHARRLPARDFGYMNREACDYPGGYAEGKVVPREYLEEVAERGSEPARAAFVGARILSSRLPDLEALIERITAYPEAERDAKLQSFHAQILIQYWYLGEAERLGERYLAVRAATDYALFVARLFLAYNRILFPYHKWLMHELRGAPEKPPELVELLERLLAEPCVERANPVLAAALNFREWESSPLGPAGQFMEDTEWSWRRGEAPIADR
jgi:predicted nucleotidyltransferase